ncbi:TIGR02452 family protein [Amycolatopsis sp. NPDC051372]|uniref:TIGR02452 family protein n=1 Tax=unclassified Amycolatopsis TaxID=2618356 RepID=UPI00342CBACB
MVVPIVIVGRSSPAPAVSPGAPPAAQPAAAGPWCVGTQQVPQYNLGIDSWVVGESLVVVNDQNAVAYALADGTQRWQAAPPSEHFCGAGSVVADNHIAVGFGDLCSSAALLDAGTGNLLWQRPLPITSSASPSEATLDEYAALEIMDTTIVFAHEGGFLNGAQAQEEAIARSSALYACLLEAREFYEYHRANSDLCYGDRVIHSPGVPVFRGDHGALLPEATTVAFLTAAAPNLGAIKRNQPEHEASVPAVPKRRAERVVEIAASHGHRKLVLGAWGCGMFENDPAVVASAFRKALDARPHFEHVTFAVLDRRAGEPAYAAFARTFGR